MAKTIAITNQKGGVGKTTTAINLSASLAATKQRILLIDLDPQGNASVGSRVLQKELPSINEVLLDEVDTTAAIIKTEWHYDIIPAHGNLTIAEVRLLRNEQREQYLKQKLLPLADQYDFILIDCPPSLNMLTVNALVAANSVIIPIQCEYYALEGLASLLQNIERIRQTANPDLVIEGLLRTMYDGRNRLTVEVSQQLIEHFQSTVYQTVIPRNVRIAEAPSHGMPALCYDKNSPGAIAYLTLAGEMLRRQTVISSQLKDVEVN